MNLPIEAILLIVAIVFLFLAYIVLNIFGKKEDDSWKAKARSELSNIIRLSKSESLEEVQSALIKSDKLLDYALKNSNVIGENMGMRLKNAKKLFSKRDYNNIWEAHKLRNKAVHEMDFRSSKKFLLKNINYLKSAVNKLSK